MLLVTTTVGMVDGVHGDTTDLGPSVSLCAVLVVSSAGPEEGLIGSLATSDDTNHTSAGAKDGLSDTGRKSDSGFLTILGVTDDDSGGAGSAGEAASVSELGLDVGDDGTFGHGVYGQDVADGKRSFVSTVDEHSSVHAFNSDEVLSALLVFVLVSEHDLGEGGTSTSVVDDVSHDTLDVAGSLGEVEGSEAGGGNSLAGVRLENGRATVTLGSDNFSH